MVLIIVVVLVTAGGIWYWEAHQSSPAQSSSSSSVAETTTSSSLAASSEFMIPEWGVEFQVPSFLSGLVYEIPNKQDQATVATFSTNDLEKLAPSCSPSMGQGIGSLSRWFYSPTGTPAPTYIHIGDYAYAFIEPTGNCAEPGALPGGNFTITTTTQRYSQESSQLEMVIDNTLTAIVPSASATQTTSTYQNADYGISFEYPSNFTIKPGDAAEGDYGLYIKYDPGAVSLITVEMPTSSYPGTGFEGAYFNLSVDAHLDPGQCFSLTSQAGPGGGGHLTIGGVVFDWRDEGSVAAGTDFDRRNYSGYANGVCYYFNLGDRGGANVNGVTGASLPSYAGDMTTMEGLLSSVKFTSL
jgi:hypothetical protein